MNVVVPIKDIPQSVLDDVGGLLKNYLVAIYVLLPAKPQPRLRDIGSGTLVEIEGTHHILTAAHVWHETKDAKEIGLVLTDYQSSFMMPRNAMPVKELWNGKISEWGPDLALLRLAQPFVSTIAAHKSFLNLAQQKESLVSCSPATEKGLWVVTGMVGKFSDIQLHPETKTIQGHIQGEAFFSSVQETHQRDGFDYYDLAADLQLPGVPSSFCGVSGGGLWEVNLLMTKSKEIAWNEKRHFRGVAFWESAGSDGHRVIRCHGPRSIFEKAWESWALPRGR